MSSMENIDSENRKQKAMSKKRTTNSTERLPRTAKAHRSPAGTRRPGRLCPASTFVLNNILSNTCAFS